MDDCPLARVIIRRRGGAPVLVQGSGTQLPFVNTSFDCVLAMPCFEYFDHRQFFQKAHSVLRTSCLLIFEALNRSSYKGMLKLILGRKLGLPSVGLSYRAVLTASAHFGFAIHMTRGYTGDPSADGATMGS